MAVVDCTRRFEWLFSLGFHPLLLLSLFFLFFFYFFIWRRRAPNVKSVCLSQIQFQQAAKYSQRDYLFASPQQISWEDGDCVSLAIIQLITLDFVFLKLYWLRSNIVSVNIDVFCFCFVLFLFFLFFFARKKEEIESMISPWPWAGECKFVDRSERSSEKIVRNIVGRLENETWGNNMGRFLLAAFVYRGINDVWMATWSNRQDWCQVIAKERVARVISKCSHQFNKNSSIQQKTWAIIQLVALMNSWLWWQNGRRSAPNRCRPNYLSQSC